jgi:hypothetical protein
MITGITEKQGMNRKVVWFARNTEFCDCLKDVTLYDFQGKVPALFLRKSSNTLIKDLSISEDTILKQCTGDTRNQINRALRQNYEYTMQITVLEFTAFFNSFAVAKNIPTINASDLQKWGKHLMLSGVKKDNQFLTMHANIIDYSEKKACTLCSATVRMQKIVDHRSVGIANRFCRYQNMLELKKRGILLYDFGGIYTGTKDKARIGIAEFKKSFGGTLTTQVAYYSFLSALRFVLGRIIFRLTGTKI